MKKRCALVGLAAFGLMTTVAGAAISIYHFGTSCSIYQDGQLIYHLACNAGETAHCQYNNGQANLYCTKDGSQ